MGSREQTASSNKRRSSRDGSSGSLLTMGTIASTLEEARASLKQPSRPFTPAHDGERHMFTANVDYSSRPSTAYGVDSSNFLEGLVRPPTASTKLAPLPTLIPKEPAQQDSEKRFRRKSASSNNNGSPKSTSTDSPTTEQRRPKKSEMDNLRATLEAAIPATPPTTPRGGGGGGGQEEGGKSEIIKPSTAAWLRVKECLPLLEPSNSNEIIVNGISQLNTILKELSDSTGASRPLSPPKAKYVLERLFRLTDMKDTILLMRVCKLVYMITDGATHILNICKLLYKLSKSAENDNVFRKEKILDLLVEMSSQEKDPRSKILVYGIGTLKNITVNETNQRSLAEIPAIFTIIHNLITSSLDMKGDEKIAQLLIQITATLRNLSMWRGTRQQISDAIPNLCSILSGFGEHMEVVSNIVRILSKVTITLDNQKLLSNSPTSISDLMKALQSYSDNEALVLRTCFVLGNITVTNDQNRKSIFYTCDGMAKLLPLLVKYNLSDSDNSRWVVKLEKSLLDLPAGPERVERERKLSKLRQTSKETEQVLVKLVRVLANLAINEEIGHTIAATPEIETLIQILEHKNVIESEELVLNVVSAITNLSCYYTLDNILLKNHIRISKLLVPLLLNKNEEVIVESLRSYANFLRDTSVRQFMAETKLDTMLALLIDHNSPEVVHTACGALMNFLQTPSLSSLSPSLSSAFSPSTSPSSSPSLSRSVSSVARSSVIAREGVIGKLVDRLVNTDVNNVSLCETICKTIYNIVNLGEKDLFTPDQIELLTKYLSMSLDIISSQDDDGDVYEVLPAPNEKERGEREDEVIVNTEDQKANAEFIDVANQLLSIFR